MSTLRAGIVLAAGRGSRLAPLTDEWAKPALPLADRPLMTWALDTLYQAGAERIGVNLYHAGQTVVDVVDAWRAGLDGRRPEIVYVTETELMGTGGGARRVWQAMGRPQGPVAVLNGDAWIDVELASHVEAHRRLGAEATLLISEAGEGGVYVDNERSLVVALPVHDGLAGRPEAGREVSFTGASILQGSAFEALSTGPGCLLRNGLSGQPLASGRVAMSRSRGRHLDVGTPARYWAATRLRLDELVATPSGQVSGAVRPGAVFVAPDAQVDRAAALGPYAVIGPGARIEAGASVAHAVVGHARIDYAVEHQVRWGRAQLSLRGIEPEG